MITNIEYSKGPHPSLFQINYVLGNDHLTLLALRKYLRAFEVLTDFQDLDRYTPDMAKVFLANLRQQSVSPSYMHRITSETQKFIRWLADEPFDRYIENITHDDRIVALQQDFGHSSIGTTRCNYGNITPSRQRELIAGIKVE